MYSQPLDILVIVRFDPVFNNCFEANRLILRKLYNIPVRKNR